MGGLAGQGGEQTEEAGGADPEDGQVDPAAGMLATAVMVGRKTAGGARTSDGRGTRAGAGRTAPQGLGAAAGGGPSAGHQTDPRAVSNDDRGRGADTSQEIPAKGWKDIAKRSRKEVKADQVPSCPF